MCNPPFFESMDEAGTNPKTSCGGTSEEMVCPGGEKAFITRIIEDSVVLKQSFRWFTSMVGRKSNMKPLISKLWAVGVSVVKTTEFVQGETCRWGLAWSFTHTSKNAIAPRIAEKNNLSFVLEGLNRQFGAIHVLKSVESYFLASGTSCKLDPTLFVVDVTISNESFDAILKSGAGNSEESTSCHLAKDASNGSIPLDNLSFCISVFQQIPGSLLLKGSVQRRQSSLSGKFSMIFQQLELALKREFCKHNAV
ncbi:hypothetical protein Scep_000355 [Stephania cephalantha]|uniref:U6 small nuclear RNA (adenine-(43)-N(6))-methyltransferase n=1 Tax=Stephania cephalantha TaxID=152367 RepID=A0AAP0LA39_9MAGN